MPTDFNSRTCKWQQWMGTCCPGYSRSVAHLWLHNAKGSGHRWTQCGGDNISQHITTYHNISQHTAQTTSGTRSMEGEIQVMNNDNLHILIAPICTGLCKWLPSNNSSEKRMLKRSSLATCRAFCTLSQFAPAPQELEGKTLRLLPVCRFLGKNFAPQILTCAVYVLESFGCECCVNGVVGVLGS